MESYHQWSVSWLENSFERLFYFLKRCLERLVCFFASCIESLCGQFMPCCNITEHINWSNVFLPLNCWMGRRYSLRVNLHLRFSGSLKDYLFFKDNVSTCFNMSLTRNVDLECFGDSLYPSFKNNVSALFLHKEQCFGLPYQGQWSKFWKLF